MKNIIISSIKQLIADRYLLSLLSILIVLALSMSIYIGVTIEASELRVVTHYTAYGVTHFYRDQWLYLIGYILFALLTAALYVTLCLKLLREDKRPLAATLAWVGIGMIILAWATYLRVAEFS